MLWREEVLLPVSVNISCRRQWFLPIHKLDHMLSNACKSPFNSAKNISVGNRGMGYAFPIPLSYLVSGTYEIIPCLFSALAEVLSFRRVSAMMKSLLSGLQIALTFTAHYPLRPIEQ